ncbi:hypothetical protein LTR66_006109 [Elasticomyces elasticus]|nr:hypothetical protein LTR66_006109 [Elasticomyces elasticus]
MPINSGGNIFSRKSSLFGNRHHTATANANANASTHTLAPAPAPAHAHANADVNGNGNSSTRSNNNSNGGGPTTPPTSGDTALSKPGPNRRDSSILSLSSSVADLGSSVRRSVSLRSHKSRSSGSFQNHKARSPSSATLVYSSLSASTSVSPEKGQRSHSSGSKVWPTLSSHPLSSPPRINPPDNVASPGAPEHRPLRPPLTAAEAPKTPYSMLVAPFGHNPKRQAPDRLPPISQSTFREASVFGGSNAGASLQPSPSLPVGAHTPAAVHRHIRDTAHKRIATLDYLRRLHEGHTYHLSTLHLSQQTLNSTIPSLHPTRLARRSTAYLLLGSSLPALLDLNSTSPLDYLRALSALLAEFETYQNLHSPDGGGGNSLTRNRMAGMFKSGLGMGIHGGGGGGRKTGGRRSSAAADGAALDHHHFTNNNNNNNHSTASLSPPTLHPPTTSSDHHHPATDPHTFTHLLTPPLPFDPHFATTFATLCDILIATYTDLLSLIAGAPDTAVGAAGLADAFAKADKAVRKVLLAGIVREFEEGTRAGVRGEVGGVGRLVLGGLM